MGTYNIPRNYKGESRILIIFSIKSLLTTVGGAVIGWLIKLMCDLFELGMVGVVVMALFALIGYGIGAIKIPVVNQLAFTKKIGGDSLDDILLRYIKFRKNKKIYTYTKEEE